jgi:RNA polymerase subunit RPABC4/transcription elongation factor Spt4
MHDDDDLPDGVYHDDTWPTAACRYCRAEMPEDVDLCPACGRYQSDEDTPPEPRSWFRIVMLVCAFVCALYWIARP